jgi:hypothetical protein
MPKIGYKYTKKRKSPPPLTEEHKRKISIGNIGKRGYWFGKKRPPFSLEWKNKIGKSNSISQKGKPSPNKTHGLSKSKFWNKWVSMRARCNNKNNSNYKNYGGRGILVCSHWMEFENFKNDMYISYMKHCVQFGEKETSIDRIDNNGNYELSNCKWSTKSEQMKNRRMTNILNHKRNKLGQYNNE